VGAFWARCKDHVNEGRETLDQVKLLTQAVSDNNTPLEKGIIVDLYQVTLELATEVTYFECKLREFGVEL